MGEYGPYAVRSVSQGPDLKAAPFWVDEEYDREAASGTSRFAAYIRNRAETASEWWGDPDAAAFWAWWVWDIATPPIMSPGYIDSHPRILSSRVIRSGYDGTLIGAVDVIIDRPRVRAADGGLWRGWSTGPCGSLEGPDERQETEGRYLLPHADATAPLDISLSRLRPPDPYDDLGAAARDAVRLLVEAMNRAFGELIQ